jgi:transcriptional regulator with XRE-family HTH domain
MTAITASTSLGDALRHWRRIRHLSQMDLALEADISARHLSFIETGRSQPSRDVVLQLAAALHMPYRHRNSLLLAAGFAPQFSASTLEDEHMEPVKYALVRHLEQHEPYPAVVVNPTYDILMANEGFKKTVSWFAGPDVLDKYANMARLTFAEDGLRPYLTCWPFMRDQLLARLHEEALMAQNDAIWQLIADLEALEPDSTATPPDMSAGLPLINIELVRNGCTYRFFSTITSFGTPLDATVQELRLESLFPADEATRKAFDA